MGLEAPSPAWLARIFRQEGVARAEPSKRPRAAWRRFDLPRPQRPPAARRHRVRPGRRAQGGDLAGSRTTTPAWRWPPWSPRARPVRRPSTSSTRARPPGARTRRPRGRQRRGPGPQPAPSHRPPGGARALPGRRTPRRQTLQAHHLRATTSASTRPCSATRAGSPWPTPSPSPRSRSTASTTPCNTQRPHQGLPGRITPQQAQDAGEVARAPRPGHDTDPITPGGEPARDAPAGRRPPHRRRPIAPSGEREAGHHPQRHRPHRRHRVPGPPRPGRAPNHRDLGRHHHHLRRRPRPAS